MKCEALGNFGYGVYLLSAKDGSYDNGCIVNTVMQTGDEPASVAVAVGKDSKTCEIINRTGEFNITVLTEDVPLETIKHFGEVSGDEKDKFQDNAIFERSDNGLCYLNTYANAFVSGRVAECKDLGNHMIFFAPITESRIFSNVPSLSYSKYKAMVKEAY